MATDGRSIEQRVEELEKWVKRQKVACVGFMRDGSAHAPGCVASMASVLHKMRALGLCDLGKPKPKEGNDGTSG